MSDRLVAVTVSGAPGVSPQPVSSVRRTQILLRPNRHDLGRIDIVVGVVVMPLNVIEIDGLGDSWLLIEILQITEKIWVIDNATNITFEMSVVNRIKAHKSYEQAPVGL